MIWILLSMLVILGLAALVFLYVAYPHRGRPVPNAEWLGEAMSRGVDRLPTLDNTLDDSVDNRR